MRKNLSWGNLKCHSSIWLDNEWSDEANPQDPAFSIRCSIFRRRSDRFSSISVIIRVSIALGDTSWYGDTLEAEFGQLEPRASSWKPQVWTRCTGYCQRNVLEYPHRAHFPDLQDCPKWKLGIFYVAGLFSRYSWMQLSKSAKNVFNVSLEQAWRPIKIENDYIRAKVRSCEANYRNVVPGYTELQMRLQTEALLILMVDPSPCKALAGVVTWLEECRFSLLTRIAKTSWEDTRSFKDGKFKSTSL